MLKGLHTSGGWLGDCKVYTLCPYLEEWLFKLYTPQPQHSSEKPWERGLEPHTSYPATTLAPSNRAGCSTPPPPPFRGTPLPPQPTSHQYIVSQSQTTHVAHWLAECVCMWCVVCGAQRVYVPFWLEGFLGGSQSREECYLLPPSSLPT